MDSYNKVCKHQVFIGERALNAQYFLPLSQLSLVIVLWFDVGMWEPMTTGEILRIMVDHVIFFIFSSHKVLTSVDLSLIL
ncbi:MULTISPECIES: hypothetical protein [unclassified Saccharicrinis]|uniref:hypothetical protein n=1 Tax=unclassified Saccharicrinis TaxID=2646859 RepID=UPI003D348313